MAIRSHMGQWVEDKEDRPFTQIDRLVHLADYIASRNFWDIPQITAEYQADENPLDILDDESLPFWGRLGAPGGYKIVTKKLLTFLTNCAIL